MANINELIGEFTKVATNPRAKMDEVLASGKKVVGVMPYFAPEELVYALGMIPFGLWGAEIQASESKKYFPAFYCSLIHTTLELGISGAFKGLSAVMIPLICDSLKGMGPNWQYGVKDIPVIDVPYAENRKIAAGKEFTTTKFKKIAVQLEEIAGRKLKDEDVLYAITVFNANREECLKFTKLAAEHPELISCLNRAYILKSRFFMDRKEHTALLMKLNAELEAAPKSEWKGKKVFTTGIIEDTKELMQIFDDNKLCIAGDQITHESIDFRYPVPVNYEDPISAYGERLANIEGASVLFDPKKVRCFELPQLAKEAGADGVIWVGCKFCDPEEFDYVIAKREVEKAGIPFATIEIDQQMVNYEQVRTIIETFKDII